MGSLIFQDHKITDLIDLLLRGDFDENRPLTLTLLSCYFSFEAANTIIDRLVKKLESKRLKLEKIQLYIDRGIALEIGKKELLDFFEKLQSKSQNLIVKFNLINQESMFHCKAYCLSDQNYPNQKGSLVVGSANLTNAALTDPKGNIELLLATQETGSIVSFFEDLKKLHHIPLLEIEKFDRDDYYWKFALIKEGIFVKNDDIKISDLLTYTYEFNTKGKKERQTEKDREKNPEGKAFKTLHKNYFEDFFDLHKSFKKYNKYYDIGWGDYGISTDFGYWIPQQLLDYLSKKNQLTQCKTNLKKEFETHQNKALEEMKNDCDYYFIKQYWIDNISEWKTENYKKRIKNALKQLEKKASKDKKQEEKARIHFDLMSDSDSLEVREVKHKIDNYCQQQLDNMKNDLLSEDNLKSLLYRYKINESVISFHGDYNRKKNKKIYNIIYNDIKKKLVQDPETIKSLESKIQGIVSRKQRTVQNENPDLNGYNSIQNYEKYYEEFTKEITKECFETKGYLIPRCLLIAIATRDLGYIRWLKTEHFLRERGKTRGVESPEME